ncbi:5722_t:CDS:10 [Scutellospora calospora]|uniref:5722_t:CDS:1 n=1 Tax=Scutellospora calospora TaxID=85575 RepID=A0ACA9JUG8_9GLOM|nr:5722_t:CDS:10 [Scutellospora calospora]
MKNRLGGPVHIRLCVKVCSHCCEHTFEDFLSVMKYNLSSVTPLSLVPLSSNNVELTPLVDYEASHMEKALNQIHSTSCIELESDGKFFIILLEEIYQLNCLQKQNQDKFLTNLQNLQKLLIDVTSPFKKDLYTWRKIFLIYIEDKIFVGNTEADRKERNWKFSQEQLACFIDKVNKNHLVKKLKDPSSKTVFEKFLKLNNSLVLMKQFQYLNQMATSIILEKHDKETHPNSISDFQHLVEKDSFLSENTFKSLCHAMEQLTTIIPQLVDYNCPICLMYKKQKEDDRERIAEEMEAITGLRIDEGQTLTHHSKLPPMCEIQCSQFKRKVISPAFSIKYITSLEKLMLSCVKDLVYNIDEMLKSKGPVLNIVNLIQTCAVDIIGETSFGGKFNNIKTGEHPLPKKVWVELKRRVLISIFPLLKPWLTEDPYLRNFSNNIITSRRKANKQKNDILQILLNTFDDDYETKKTKNKKEKQIGTENRMTDHEVYDQILEFLVAGTDSVSFTTTMAIVQLSKNPQKLLSLVKELDKVLSIDELPTHDKLKELKYLNAVINETMRLWPVFLDGGIGRTPDKDSILGKYMIPKDASFLNLNTSLILNFYKLHHDPKYWGEDVEEFIPERWLEPENIPRDVYYPFSAGPRNCIGQK